MRNKHRRGYQAAHFELRTIALERIEILINLAKERLLSDPTMARRYVERVRKISMRTKVRIPLDQKRFLCKYCNLPLVPGLNARVRTAKKTRRVIITCLSCGGMKRYPIGNKP